MMSDRGLAEGVIVCHPLDDNPISIPITPDPSLTYARPYAGACACGGF